MDWKKFIIHAFLERSALKFLQLGLVIFMGSILGAEINPWGLLGAILYYLAYFSIYIYNDLMDYEKDVKKKVVYDSKALVKGYATKEEYITLLAFLPIFLFLATLWDPVLGFIVMLAIVLNNVRTKIKDIFWRQILLVLVQVVNFEGFWQAMYSSLIPAIFLPLFLSFSLIYSGVHILYKVDIVTKEGIISGIKRKEIKRFVISAAISIIFSLPSFILSPFHFLATLLAVFLFSIPPLIAIDKYSGDYEKISKIFTLTAFLVGGLFIGTAVIYIKIGSPLDLAVPFFEEMKRELGKSYTAASYFDKLQQKMIERVFGGLTGMKGKVA